MKTNIRTGKLRVVLLGVGEDHGLLPEGLLELTIGEQSTAKAHQRRREH